MHIRTTREDFLAELNKVVGVVERRQTLPILGNLLIATGDQSIQLTSTDLEVEIRAKLNAGILEPGEVTVPARKLIDICRALPEGAEISLKVESGRAVVSAGRSRFALSTLPAADFPIMESGAGGDERLEISKESFRHLLEKTAFAMANQDVRYYLNGLLLDMDGKRLIAVATDGHRLAKVEATMSLEVSEHRQIILPRKTVLEITRLLGGGVKDAEILVDVSEKTFRAFLDDAVITSKLVDGRYPEYERVIPHHIDKFAVADRDVLRQALVRTSILSGEKYKGVRLSFDHGQLKLQAHNPEQEEAEDEVEIAYSSDPTAIGFNVSYLLDILNVLEEREVELGFADSNSSTIVRNKGKDQETFVVMPMRL